MISDCATARVTGPNAISKLIFPAFISKLVSSGATWGSKCPSTHDVDDVDDVDGIPPSPFVRTLSGVKYGDESTKQSLDLYYPEDYASRHLGVRDETKDGTDKRDDGSEHPSQLPVFIHIHGGGWSRGDKNNRFYGVPSVCRTMASAGCLSIAVGYRLGEYPRFVEDACLGIRWIYDNVSKLGGDKQNMFLAGHSAGGHIASLIMVRHETFLQQPHSIPPDFLRGMILLSGVYDLFEPMKKASIDVKNKWYKLAYVRPAFGTDAQLLLENSPLLLLNPDAKNGLETDSSKRNSKLVDSVVGSPTLSKQNSPLLHKTKSIRRSRSSLKKMVGKIKEKGAVGKNNEDETYGDCNVTITDNSDIKHKECKTREVVESDDGDVKNKNSSDGGNDISSIAVNTALPPTLIMNASYDMGLELNGELMCKAMSKYTEVEHVRIPSTNHASISWNEDAAVAMKTFIKSKIFRLDEEESSLKM
uniref:BD-FAE-like domain-containing protein n=1 Tax=Ditylum brightwellii TaxID=49249 RepID=A0A7S4QPP3_9STRA